MGFPDTSFSFFFWGGVKAVPFTKSVKSVHIVSNVSVGSLVLFISRRIHQCIVGLNLAFDSKCTEKEQPELNIYTLHSELVVAQQLSSLSSWQQCCFWQLWWHTWDDGWGTNFTAARVVWHYIWHFCFCQLWAHFTIPIFHDTQAFYCQTSRMLWAQCIITNRAFPPVLSFIWSWVTEQNKENIA